jgi:hypothetical protein
MKNLKKIVFKNKTIIVLLVLVAVLAGAVFFYIDKKTNSAVNNDQKNPVQNESNQPTDEEIANNVANKKVPEGTTTTGSSQATPQSSNATEIAKSVSLQGVINQEEQTAAISLYGMAAYYTVEILEDGSYKPLISNSFYQGRGGLSVNTLKANSPSGTEYHYRIYPVIDGVKSSIYSEVLVDWNLIVSSGVKSFPGGL